MEINLKLINETATPEVVRRGRACFHEGRVELEVVEKGLVRASVRGSGLYTVELQNTNLTFNATCTCPFQWEGKCKHIVAVMLATLYRNAKLDYTPAPPATEQREELSSGWVKDVMQLLAPAGFAAERSDASWRLVYSLKIADSRRILYPLKVKTSHDGHDGPASLLRKADIYQEPHFDHVDRLLLERLINGFSTSVPADSGEAHLADGEDWARNDKIMGDMLALLVGRELYLAQQNNYVFRRLDVAGEPAHVRIGLSERADGTLVLEPELEHDGIVYPLPSTLIVLSIDTLWVLFETRVLNIVGVSAADFAVLMRLGKQVVIPPSDKPDFMEDVLPGLVKRFRVRSELSSIKAVDATPVPRLYLNELNDKLNIELRFAYDGIEVKETSRQGDDVSSVPELIANEGTCIVVNRKAGEESAFSRLLAARSLISYYRNDGSRNYMPSVNPYEWLLKKLPGLKAAGFEIYGQEDLRRHRIRSEKPRIGVRVSSGIDWFDMSVEVKFDVGALSFREFIDTVKSGEQYVRLDDGTIGVLPEAWLKKFRRALSVGDADQNALKLSRAHLGLLDDLATAADEFESDRKFAEVRERLRSFTSIRKKPLPKKFEGELRPYQRAGYDWLNFLREFGVGGILADDMGLGKTVQTLCLLQRVYEEGEKKPSLIVVPTSPLFNWQKEIERFTPSLKTLVYSGAERRTLQKSFDQFQVILTSYGILRRDVDFLEKREFLYVVLDESQNIKNPISVNAQAVRSLNAEHRLALSGTPVENNLLELWSQFTFLNPGMLGSERTFAENFAKPIEKSADESASSTLKQMIFPFILRRTKELVATELPPKVESTVYCDMEPEQQRAYEYWRQYYRESILHSIETVGLNRSKMKVLEGLMRLRQVCCHPGLVDLNYRGTAGKFEAFREMLEDILAEGHKVLVFSQFVKMLEILRQHCEKDGIVYEYLDGSTRNRRERVERFQNDENVKLFLISLKAGGTGLNLTAADYVIHYDPWWNPAVEMQATDRTHRIGQTRQVFSYKLITRETVEEKILALQEKKMALVKNIITTDSGFVKSLTREDVEALFG